MDSYPLTPLLLYKSQFRQYRLRLKNNGFMKVKKKIYTPEQLKAILDKINPIDVYQTVSWFLNPQLLGAKEVKESGYPILQHSFIGSDFLLDFDMHDYKTEDEMMSNLNLARSQIKELGMTEFILMKTGAGRQLLNVSFNDWAKQAIKATHPRDREYAYQYKMRNLTFMLLTGKENPTDEEIKKAKVNPEINFDWECSMDTRRICRTPNTKHRNGNTIKLLEYPKSKDYLIFAD